MYELSCCPWMRVVMWPSRTRASTFVELPTKVAPLTPVSGSSYTVSNTLLGGAKKHSHLNLKTFLIFHTVVWRHCKVVDERLYYKFTLSEDDFFLKISQHLAKLLTRFWLTARFCAILFMICYSKTWSLSSLFSLSLRYVDGQRMLLTMLCIRIVTYVQVKCRS